MGLYKASSSVLALAGIIAALAVAGSADKVPALYVFGDSLADVGNNNYLNISAKANFPFYGIDFPHSVPTGRFSNGYNTVDFFAKGFGFRRSPPAYLFLLNNQHNRTKLINNIFNKGLIGANFASGGSGILNSTGDTITFSEQIQYFAELKAQIQAAVNTSHVADLLAESIFIIISGGNDAFAFFAETNNGATATNAAVELFVGSFVSNYSVHVQQLYALGARKFAVANISPIGCCPVSRLYGSTGGCVTAMNELAGILNNVTAALFAELGSKLPGFRYSIGDALRLLTDLIVTPAVVRFTDVADACCGGGKFNAETPCRPNATLCADRRNYLFWDAVHRTQQASKIVAEVFYSGVNKYTAPISYKQLAAAHN